MKTLSHIMATTAVATLIGGAAFAQAASVGAEVDAGAAVGAAELGAEANTSATASQTGTPGATSPAAEAAIGAAPTASASAGVSQSLTLASESLERGETVEVISADGRVLGQVDSAVQDKRGAAQLSIALDRDLGVSAQRVTFVGLTSVDADGRLVLPLGEADFLSRIEAQTAASSG